MKRAAGFFAFAAGAIVLAVFLSPFASQSPDGLEKVAQDKGFFERGERAPVWGFAALRDYEMPGVNNDFARKSLAGLIGAALVFGLAFGVGKLVAKKSTSNSNGTKS